jgi:hypothetical protein
MAHEAAAVTKAWGDVLAADSTLISLVSTKIFAGTAPDNAAAPYIVGRQKSPGSDEYVFGGTRVYTEPLIDVGIVVADDEHSTTAQSGASRIDALLNPLSDYQVTDATGASWKVTFIREGGAWTRPEIDKGKKFFWVGHSYRVYVCPA